MLFWSTLDDIFKHVNLTKWKTTTTATNKQAKQNQEFPNLGASWLVPLNQPPHILLISIQPFNDQIDEQDQKMYQNHKGFDTF